MAQLDALPNSEHFISCSLLNYDFNEGYLMFCGLPSNPPEMEVNGKQPLSTREQI